MTKATCQNCHDFKLPNNLPANYHTKATSNYEGICSGYDEIEYRSMDDVCERHRYNGIDIPPLVQLQL